MLPRKHPDRIHITFNDRRLVDNAGLILPATLARHLRLPQLVQECLDLGNAPGRANTGDKMMTLVASAPRFRGGRVWRAATALTTPTCCAPAGRPALSAAWSRRHPPWGPFRWTSTAAMSMSSVIVRPNWLAKMSHSPHGECDIDAKCPASTIFAGWRQSVLPRIASTKPLPNASG